MAPSTKDTWRVHFRAFRQSLSSCSYRARSSLIDHRVLALPEVATAEVVHVYWALQDRGEVDTRLIIAALRQRDVEVVLPVVTSFDSTHPTLEHRRYEGPARLETNRWDLREPAGTKRVSPDTLDAILVPALGADRSGHRIGQGSGYYDTFLASVACPRIALVYEDCLVPSLPSAPHDVPMTTLVTEKNVITP